MKFFHRTKCPIELSQGNPNNKKRESRQRGFIIVGAQAQHHASIPQEVSMALRLPRGHLQPLPPQTLLKETQEAKGGLHVPVEEARADEVGAFHLEAMPLLRKRERAHAQMDHGLLRAVAHAHDGAALRGLWASKHVQGLRRALDAAVHADGHVVAVALRLRDALDVEVVVARGLPARRHGERDVLEMLNRVNVADPVQQWDVGKAKRVGKRDPSAAKVKG